MRNEIYKNFKLFKKHPLQQEPHIFNMIYEYCFCIIIIYATTLAQFYFLVLAFA